MYGKIIRLCNRRISLMILFSFTLLFSSFGMLTHNAIANITTTTIRTGMDTLPIGVAVNPNTNKIYVTTNQGNGVLIIDGNTSAISGAIKVGSRP